MHKCKETLIMKFVLCILYHLFATGNSWPRYGRPHPLYSSRQQTNENILANAILLGLDYNEIQLLQAASGQSFGLGNLGWINNGFPLNARERNMIKQDVNTLTALGIIDSAAELGLGDVAGAGPDPPDNPVAVGNDKFSKKIGNKGAGNGKGNGRKPAKGPLKGKRKVQGKQSASRKKLKTTINKGTGSPLIKHGLVSTGAHKKTGNVSKTSKRRKQRKGGGISPQQRGTSGDPGEGRLAEHGGGELSDRPVRQRGGGTVVWRNSGGEDARGGEGL